MDPIDVITNRNVGSVRVKWIRVLTEECLSNDPGKKGSNLFCCGAIRFPHIEMFSFSRRECINLQKAKAVNERKCI